MTIVGNVLTQFPQTNKIVKSGKDLLMSGELDLTDLDATAVSINCYVGKRKRKLSQEMEGNVVSFPAYAMAEVDVDPTITTHDLILTERGELFIVGAVSVRNDNTDINNNVNNAAYLYADLELYSE